MSQRMFSGNSQGVTATALFLLLLAAPAAHAIDIPFRWTPGQIEVQVSVNGRPPIWFIVDTGAEYSILDREVAKSYGLNGQQFIDGVTLAIGPVTLRNQRIMLLQLDNFRRQKREIRGLIGYDFFARYVVTFDFEEHVLHLSEPKSFKPPRGATRLRLQFAGRVSMIDTFLTIANRRIPARLEIDTGASQAVVLRHPFVESHDLLKVAANTTTSDSVASGLRAFVSLPVQQIEIAQWKFADPETSFYGTTQGAGGATDTDGLLGNDILRHFRVTVDYSGRGVWLEKTGKE